MHNATIYCHSLHDSMLSKIKKVGYVPMGLGSGKFSAEWLKDDTLINISHKNKYYAEYTFYYWFWKNILPKIEDGHWIGFCSYREPWGNKNTITKNSKFENVVLTQIPKEWNKFDTILGEHIFMNNLKFSKLVKHGIWSLVRNPSALLKSKRNLRFHFDMWHGNGNLDKAINVLDNKDRIDFQQYMKKCLFCTRKYVCLSF